MEYGILMNPVSGKLTLDQKVQLSERLVSALGDAKVYGLDTDSEDAFLEQALVAYDACGCSVYYVGDGSFSRGINALLDEFGSLDKPLSYGPGGTGCAAGYDLYESLDPDAVSYSIRNGAVHNHDLLACNGVVGMFASIGFDAAVLETYHSFSQKLPGVIARRLRGDIGYGVAGGMRLLDFPLFKAEIAFDSEQTHPYALSTFLANVMQYYGSGLRVMPEASWTDGLLHTRSIGPSKIETLVGIAQAKYFSGMRVGEHKAAESITVRTNDDVLLQIDGDIVCQKREFELRVLPGALKLKHM